MDVSALPYFYYFLVDFISMLIFIVIGMVITPHRPVLTWAAVWMFAGAIRYGLVVFSSGERSVFVRDDVVWWIRGMAATQATLFICVMISFIRETVVFNRPPAPTKASKADSKAENPPGEPQGPV